MALDTQLQSYTKNPIESAISTDDFVLMHVNLATSTTFAKGTAIAESIQTPGTFAAYSSGNTDGSANATAILPFTCSTDASGNITVGQNSDPYGVTYKSVPAIFGGYVRTSDVASLDATLAAKLGKIARGTTTAGILYIR